MNCADRSFCELSPAWEFKQLWAGLPSTFFVDSIIANNNEYTLETVSYFETYGNIQPNKYLVRS